MTNESANSALNLLHEAARLGDATTVAACLQLLVPHYGWEVCSHRDSASGWTPIHWACFSGNVLCLQYLIPSDLDCAMAKVLVNVMTHVDGLSAAHLSATSGHIGCLKWLLQWPCDINVKDMSGEYPLDKAVLGGHRECCQYLLTVGATGTLKSHEMLSPTLSVQSSKRKWDCDEEVEHVEKKARRLTLSKSWDNQSTDCSPADTPQSMVVEGHFENGNHALNDAVTSAAYHSFNMKMNSNSVTEMDVVTMCAGNRLAAGVDDEQLAFLCHGITSYPWDS